MKEWRIPVCWQMMGTVKVEADTLEKAIDIACDDHGVILIPDNGEYLEGSWEADCFLDVDYVRKYYNNDQEDDDNKDDDFEDDLMRPEDLLYPLYLGKD